MKHRARIEQVRFIRKMTGVYGVSVKFAYYHEKKKIRVSMFINCTDSQFDDKLKALEIENSFGHKFRKGKLVILERTDDSVEIADIPDAPDFAKSEIKVIRNKYSNEKVKCREVIRLPNGDVVFEDELKVK